MGNCISNNAICDESNIHGEFVIDNNKTYYITSECNYKNNIQYLSYL